VQFLFDAVALIVCQMYASANHHHFISSWRPKLLSLCAP